MIIVAVLYQVYQKCTWLTISVGDFFKIFTCNKVVISLVQGQRGKLGDFPKTLEI